MTYSLHPGASVAVIGGLLARGALSNTEPGRSGSPFVSPALKGSGNQLKSTSA